MNENVKKLNVAMDAEQLYKLLTKIRGYVLRIFSMNAMSFYVNVVLNFEIIVKTLL